MISVINASQSVLFICMHLSIIPQLFFQLSCSWGILEKCLKWVLERLYLEWNEKYFFTLVKLGLKVIWNQLYTQFQIWNMKWQKQLEGIRMNPFGSKYFRCKIFNWKINLSQENIIFYTRYFWRFRYYFKRLFRKIARDLYRNNNSFSSKCIFVLHLC